MNNMIIFLNGEFVLEEHAVVSIFDRGFLYGDGLFETIRVLNGKPFRWAAHLARLQRGAEFLKIKLPLPPDALRDFAGEIMAKNQIPEGLLRLTLSRGVGARGYSPKGATRPTLAMTLHPAPKEDAQNPPRWKLVTASLRLPARDPLAAFKTANKLAQVLARAEADAEGADEALLLNTDDFVAETTGANVFWMERDTVCTPPLDAVILPGVTRAAVLEICRQLNLPVTEASVPAERLRLADGIFLALSSWGVVEVAALDGRNFSPSPLAAKIRAAYDLLLQKECA